MLLSLTQGLANWWDLVNYHIYNPWALLNHREGIDVFPAGIQGYFDPLLDLPYYLVAFVWFPNHPAIVAALTGLPFGLLLFVTLLLVRETLAALTGSMTPIARWTITLITLAMAVSGVSTWSQAFSTTNEVLVSAIVLGALVLIIGSLATTAGFRRLGARRALIAGCLLGLAAGLKLTATVYAPAGGLLLLAACPDWKSAIRNGIVFLGGWVLTFAVVFGPWAVHMYAQTGNPFFPMFNSLFHSPLSTDLVGRDTRFLPGSIWEWLFYPFDWLNDQTQTVFPLDFRDMRFALVYALGIPASIAALLGARKRVGGGFSVPFALTAFWFVGYAVWLALFSMLRYAIVLEISSCVIAVGSLLYMAKRFAPNLRTTAHVGLTAALALTAILFAHIPDLGHIPRGSRTFQADVPPLGDHALVILGNEPMGLLAPLIEQANPSASFIGIPTCFTQGQWCYEGFFHSGLGQYMRDAISSHRGPMYFAYYADHVPFFPQLGSFNLRIDAKACQTMRTNRTVEVILCKARYDKTPPTTPDVTSRFKLAVLTKLANPDFVLTSAWSINECGSTANLGKLSFTWQAPASINKVRVFVVVPPSFRPQLFSGGRASGHAETGQWVNATQTFLFTDANRRELGRSTIHYVSCSDK